MPRLHTCPKCRALLDPGVKECPYCSTSVRHLAAPSPQQEALRTTGVFTWILVANVLLYIAMVALDRHVEEDARSIFHDRSNPVLAAFGSNAKIPIRDQHQVWRLATSMFLHVDFAHLVLNCVALLIVGALAAQTFGAHRTWVIYVAAGISSSLVSFLWLPDLMPTRDAGLVMPVSAGASGAICGMIGALFLYGKRRGGTMGRALSGRMLLWTVFIGAFGILMPGVDNWGHAGGFLGGLALGWPASKLTARGGRADRLWRAAAIACLAGVLACFVFAGIEVARYWRA